MTSEKSQNNQHHMLAKQVEHSIQAIENKSQQIFRIIDMHKIDPKYFCHLECGWQFGKESDGK